MVTEGPPNNPPNSNPERPQRSEEQEPQSSKELDNLMESLESELGVVTRMENFEKTLNNLDKVAEEWLKEWVEKMRRVLEILKKLKEKGASADDIAERLGALENLAEEYEKSIQEKKPDQEPQKQEDMKEEKEEEGEKIEEETEQEKLFKQYKELVQKTKKRIESGYFDPDNKDSLSDLSEAIENFRYFHQVLDRQEILGRQEWELFEQGRGLLKNLRELQRKAEEIKNQQALEDFRNTDEIKNLKNAILAIPDKREELGLDDSADQVNELKTLRQTLKKAYDLARQKNSLEKTEFESINSEINDIIERRQEAASRVDRMLSEAQKVAAFNKEIEPLKQAIEKVPSKREDLSLDDFAEQRKKLLDIQEELQTELADKRSALVKKNVPEIDNIIESVRREADRSLARLDDLIAETEKPPIKDMSFKQVVNELIEESVNPFNWEWWEKQDESRHKSLVSAFHDKQHDVEKQERIEQKVRAQLYFLDSDLALYTQQATVDRQRLIEYMQGPLQMSRKELIEATTENPDYGEDIKEILNFIQHSASVPEGFMLVNRRVVQRNGEVVYLPKNEPMLTGDLEVKESSIVLIKESQFSNQDEEVFEHEEGQPKITYEDLAGEQGRTKLTNLINAEYGDRPEMARWFANKLFTATDELSVVLARLQRRTKTQAHTNNAEVDPVLLADPLAAATHRAERNGGNQEDWVLWWLACLRKIPITESLGRPLDLYSEKIPIAWALAKFQNKTCPSKDLSDFNNNRDKLKSEWRSWFNKDWGKELNENWCEYLQKAVQEGFLEEKKLTADLPSKLYPSQFLRDKQEELWLYLDCFFDVDEFRNQVPSLGYDDTYFPTPLQMAFLHEDEGESLDEQLSTIDQFRVAENSWSELLETLFQEVGSQLSIGEIAGRFEEGEKGGLISKWLGNWSAAKIFPGKHMDLFEPLTKFFFYQIAQSYKGRGAEATKMLSKAFVDGLEVSTSGGLTVTSDQMEGVVKAIQGSDSEDFSQNLVHHLRRQRRSERFKYLSKWFEHQVGEELPFAGPFDLRLYFSEVLGLSRSPQIERAADAIKKNRPLPSPLERSGLLKAPKEEKDR